MIALQGVGITSLVVPVIFLEGYGAIGDFWGEKEEGGDSPHFTIMECSWGGFPGLF